MKEYHQMEEELPFPEEDDRLVDLKFIHWGYLNCCQTVSKGKKVKKEIWNTYWVDLCGSTLRLYKDSSLSEDSALHPPPVTQYGALQEDESKVAFFDLDGGETKILQDGRAFRRKMPKSMFSKIYRRHLFQVKFHKINVNYVFQAPSHSAMLRWVLKIQESVDAIANDQISFLAEERLKLARFMMEKKHWQSEQVDLIFEDEKEEDDDISEIVSIADTSKPDEVHQVLFGLKKELAEKREFLWQLEQQIIDFLGNKGEFKRKELVCTTKQEYCLVAGRMDTLIPAGTNVTIFGQLPNRRWRCLVEMDELIKVMNKLVEELHGSNAMSENRKSSEIAESADQTDLLVRRRNNLPDYPLIGCIPSSVLDMIFHDKQSVKTPSPAPEESTPGELTPIDDDDESVGNFERAHTFRSPYARHKRTKRTLPVKPWGTNPPVHSTTRTNMDAVNNQSGIAENEREISFVDGKVPEDDVICTVDDNQEEREEYIASDVETDEEILYEGINNAGFLRLAGSGIIIRKKLRQKGISILVGSSTSEDEDEEEDEVCGISNAVYRKFVASNLENNSNEGEAEWNAEERSYIRTQKKHKDLKAAFSCEHINYNGEFTTKSDLLRRFGQKSIHLNQDKALAKALIQAFDDTKKGPDVKPPRNERRTLKLSKSDEQGFGFWLQTYGFAKRDGVVQKRTFVRYVEDEGPAYLAGLREGDVVVEVNGQNVEEIDHMKIVDHITEAKKQLVLVVRFMDAVRRVELVVRLKKRQTKLKDKMEELKNLEKEENDLITGVSSSSLEGTSNKSLHHAISTDTDIDRISLNTDSISLNTSTESELSSLSSLSDEVIVRTSKFEKRSSKVLDSIKELNCHDAISSASTDINRPSITTESDLLTFYSDKDDLHNKLWKRTRAGTALKRAESMPVQKYKSLPRKHIVVDLDGNFAREYAIEHSTTGHILSESYTTDIYKASDEDSSSDECSSSQSSTGLSRARPKSYKLAMKKL